MGDNATRARLKAALLVEGGVESTASQIARSVVSTLDAIDRALSPIIGKRGVDALVQRSVHVAGKSNRWLTDPRSLEAIPDEELDNLARLEATLAVQASSDAAEGGAAILQSFHELLTSLIRAPLTERLLRGVWQRFHGALPPQDSQ